MTARGPLFVDYTPIPPNPTPSGAFMRKLNYAEPAVLRGIVTAVLALAAALGFVATDEIKGAAEGLIPVIAFVLPLLQSLWTRQAVVPLEKHVDQMARAAGHVVTPQTPGVADHAADRNA